jgi:hypothetical protein
MLFQQRQSSLDILAPVTPLLPWNHASSNHLRISALLGTRPDDTTLPFIATVGIPIGPKPAISLTSRMCSKSAEMSVSAKTARMSLVSFSHLGHPLP